MPISASNGSQNMAIDLALRIGSRRREFGRAVICWARRVQRPVVATKNSIGNDTARLGGGRDMILIDDRNYQNAVVDSRLADQIHTSPYTKER